MFKTKPRVYLVGQTVMDPDAVAVYLKDIGADEWVPDLTISDGENLAEMAGRMCYRSWQPLMNPNVTKVRQGNDSYLKHVLEVGHESLLEHIQLNFIFKDVSRVFTHELVRHRVGTAYSQESGRYVRLTDIGFRIPECIEENEEAKAIFEDLVEQMEDAQKKLSDVFKIDDEKKFAVKKALTSAFRRIAPIGLSTSIFFSVNIRELRHIIQLRTSMGAEEEIRFVFDEVASLVKMKYPNFFQDINKNDDGEWVKVE